VTREIPITLVVEDDLSECVLRTILRQIDRPYRVALCLGRRGNTYIKSKMRAFNSAAKGAPFLVLTDLDQAECAPEKLRQWLPVEQNPNLIFRFAVREVEAWVLAHRSQFARFLGLQREAIPLNVDDIDHPKEFLINLARRSRRTDIKGDLVPRGTTSRQGPNYNGRLTDFVISQWDAQEAVKHSDSLRRAVRALSAFRPEA
jgi:hypothetical protein